MKIKEGLEKEFATYTKLDGNEESTGMPVAYFQAIIDAAHVVGDALDAGKTPDEAIKALNGRELTGYMAGNAASMVVHFNPRGDELRPAWNKHCGGTGEEKGTINPAILEM